MMRFALVLSMASLLECYSAPAAPISDIRGTWGGDNAGLIVSNTDVHIHIGCTLGDALGPINPDADGRFEATGTYNVNAYPVDRGIVHPASFTGRIVGQTMTLIGYRALWFLREPGKSDTVPSSAPGRRSG